MKAKSPEDWPTRPTIYIENDVPTWTIGGPTFTSEAIALCGADNIFGDLADRAPRVSAETIIQRNPDFILSFVARRRASSVPAGVGEHRRLSGTGAESLTGSNTACWCAEITDWPTECFPSSRSSSNKSGFPKGSERLLSS